jgi:hypothetical protein
LLGEFCSDGFERVLIDYFTVWTAEMGHEDDCFRIWRKEAYDIRVGYSGRAYADRCLERI